MNCPPSWRDILAIPVPPVVLVRPDAADSFHYLGIGDQMGQRRRWIESKGEGEHQSAGGVNLAVQQTRSKTLAEEAISRVLTHGPEADVRIVGQ